MPMLYDVFCNYKLIDLEETFPIVMFISDWPLLMMLLVVKLPRSLIDTYLSLVMIGGTWSPAPILV